MFICSVCNERIVGIDQDSTYTTLCGHAFHYLCIIRWLESSQTCPLCRSSVLKNDLIKLCLKVDPNIQVLWDGNTSEKINTLDKQLVQLKDKEIRDANLIYRLETQIKETKSVLDMANKTKELLAKNNANLKKSCSEVSTDLRLSNEQYKATEIIRIKSQKEYLSLKLKMNLQHQELNSLRLSNSYTIDQLKFERADLKAEKAYLERSYCNLKNINIKQPSTSKKNIKEDNAILFKNQTKDEYYGHDPQLQLTSKQFLLGCVFLFIDVQNHHEDRVCNINTTMSKANVIKYGGLVDELYSVHVTHIICATQKHCIVEKGLNDGKRCVTDYWLNDIIAKKKMVPPWLALHFPILYRSDSLPCQHFLFSIGNFGVSEVNIIKTMIDVVGGQYIVKEVTSKIDILVSLKLEGEIVEKALAINKPVVNVQWLNDILFGAQLGLKEPANLKYQKFDLCNPFLVNYDMVSELMEAWKTPLSIHKNQQLFDLTLNSDSITKFKSQKTNLFDNNNDVTMPPKPCVMFSGFPMEDIEIFKKIVHIFGGTVANHCLEVTHLIMRRNPRTTIEFFCCLSTVKYILNENWLKDSHSKLKLQDEGDYCIEVIKDDILGWYTVSEILKCNMRFQLFGCLSFFVTPGIVYPSPPHLKEIISSAGGTIEKSRRSRKSIQESPPNSYFIISCKEDRLLYDDILNIEYVVYSPIFVTCSIMAQEVQLYDFSL